MKGHLRQRRFVLVASFLAVVAAVTLVLLPATAGSTTDNRIQADVVATNQGPLPACTGSIGESCIARHNIYVRNTNRLVAAPGFSRANVRDAFVISRIDVTVFVNGVDTYDYFYTPPPDTNYPPYAGHWVSAVTCASGSPPCNEVGSPAVLPGENTAIFYDGWGHADYEVNGLHVFRYTIHGTVNGEPVDVTASSQPIQMTD
jgi:hypothetical protein